MVVKSIEEQMVKTIKVRQVTQDKLDARKIIPRETYDSVISRLLEK